MNCECILISKTARQDHGELKKLAAALRPVSEHIEMYPVSISEITTKTASYSNYDNARFEMGTKTILKPGDLVLFLYGKYHYMTKTALRAYLDNDSKKLLTGFEIRFPATTETFFRDIETFE